jgi:hypothetical protein
MKDRRLHYFSEKRFNFLASNFNDKIESKFRSRYKRAGEIIISAVADEKDGIKKAVISLENWLIDPERFPQSWITAVQETILLAREK